MQFYLNDKQKLLAEAAVESMQARAASAFTKFDHDVKSISVTVEDGNGPRGGVDKVCRILVKLRQRKDIVVSINDESLSKAISTAIERSARSVKRWLGRKEDQRHALAPAELVI